MRKVAGVLLLAAIAAALAGCGGGGDNESESQREAEQSGRGTITCEGDAMIGSAGLPAGFPELEGVTFVKAEDSGPTHAVDGYSDESLEGLYNEYKERFKEEQFTILFDELEEHDSEISYRTKDKSTEGIVALRDSCDNGNISVHITARAA
jgi:hypothetical protein